MPTGISVIICCYNSAQRITPTLQHLAVQKNISISSVEIIVVDNCSIDDTAGIAHSIWNTFDFEKPAFRVVTESTPGLSSARKKGINESNFDYVLFCDDDNWLDENYLHTAIKIMESNPRIGALGGTGSPVFEGEEPPYFWVNQYHALAVGQQSKIDGDITDERGVLYGAGMVLNKKAYNVLEEKYGFKFILTGRNGKNLTSSEDHELCLALKKIGYKIFYSKALNFQHYIPRSRTSINYYKKLFYGFGISYAMLLCYRVNKQEINHIKNDYRYICLRSVKNIIIVKTNLVIKGYYNNINKYKYIDMIHQLYSQKGILQTLLKTRNSFKKYFYNNSLLNNDM